MSADKCLRRMLGAVCCTLILFGMAFASPLIVDRFLRADPATGQIDIWACLFMPTRGDWPSHVVNYALAGVLACGLSLGLFSLLRQVYGTRLMVRKLRGFAGNQDPALLAQLTPYPALRGRLELIDIDLAIAFCYGFARPRICISTGAVAKLNRHEREALLLHEQYHLLSRDPLKTLISNVLAKAFFFLPIVSALRKEYMLARELEADRFVLESQGTSQHLLGAIYKLLTGRAQPGNNERLAIADSFGSINGRLDYLLKKRTPDRSLLPALFASAGVSAAIMAVVAVTTWASAANVLWYPAHTTLCGC